MYIFLTIKIKKEIFKQFYLLSNSAIMAVCLFAKDR